MAYADSSGLGAFLTETAWTRVGDKLKLSPREVEIAKLVMLDDGKESEIARRLRISAHTVHTHMERLHAKLGVTTRAELIIALLTTFLLLTADPDSGLAPICGERTAGRCRVNC